MPNLVLTRTAGEQIRIAHPSGDVLVTLVRTDGPNRAVLAVEAPRDVLVMRGEIADDGRVTS